MKILFEKWWNKNTKYINLISYKDAWNKSHFLIHSNGAKRKNGDTCFDFNVDLGYLHFSYTNWDLQKKKQNNLRKYYCVVDDWNTQEIKIIQGKNLLSQHEILFLGTEKECEEYINSLRSK